MQQDTLLAQLESQKREEAAQQLPYNGPHLEMGADALLFNSCASCSRGGPPASTATATLAVANQGSTAVYYVWWRQPAARLLGAAAAGTGPQRFFLADQKGVMLPGEVKEFT